jgi:hypothetical protein
MCDFNGPRTLVLSLLIFDDDSDTSSSRCRSHSVAPCCLIAGRHEGGSNDGWTARLRLVVARRRTYER